jgi:hypothetical protein
MKTERILVFEGKGKRSDFIKSVNNTMQKANELIQNFNDFQPWKVITTLQEFEDLYYDPLGMFDKTIIENIDIKAKGNKLPDPSVLSALFQINRLGYMEATGQSEPVKDADCPDCQKKTQTIKVKNIRSNAEFYQYAEYYVFINGFFQLNNNAINEHCDTFNIYAESPEQIALYKHWQGLCDTLNTHNKKYPIGNIDSICKTLKLLQLNGTFVINNISLSEQIKYLR